MFKRWLSGVVGSSVPFQCMMEKEKFIQFNQYKSNNNDNLIKQFCNLAETIKTIDQSVNMIHFPLEFLNLGKVIY